MSVLPFFPRLVFTKITPLAPLIPYGAKAAASLRIVISSISSRTSEFISRSKPSTKTSIELLLSEPIPRIFMLGYPSPSPYSPFWRINNPLSFPQSALAGLIFERFINSFPLTVEAEMVVSSNCNISDPVVFSCAQTEAMHKTGSDMMVINLFLILLF